MTSKAHFVIPENTAHWHALRAQNINSTDVSALFGVSPYSTPFELWNVKAGNVPDAFQGNSRMRWGTRLEEAIAGGVAEDFGVRVAPFDEYGFLPSKMGSSFDFWIRDWDYLADLGSSVDPIMQAMVRDHGPGIMEVKNVDGLVFRNSWTVDAETKFIEAPAHIEAQVQHQMHVADVEWCAIAALIGGNDTRIAIRKRDREVGESIERKVVEFWKSIEDNDPPSPTMPADAEFVAKLYQYATPGKVVASDDPALINLANAYIAAGAEEKDAKELKAVAKAAMLMLIGDAEKVLIPGFTISASMVGPAHVEYDREGYRGFRVFTKKGK